MYARTDSGYVQPVMRLAVMVACVLATIGSNCADDHRGRRGRRSSLLPRDHSPAGISDLTRLLSEFRAALKEAYKASKKYQVLNSLPDSPQMPTGYPGMMVLALIQPLWFSVMNPKLDLHQSSS